MRVLAIAVVLFAVSGCGFLLVEGPPRVIPANATSLRCTESKTLPTLDGVWAGLNFVGAILVASDPDAFENPNAAIGFGAAWTIFSGFSAKSGFDKVADCREAVDMVALRNR